MKIALASARIIDRDVPHNMAQMKHWMQEAAAAGAELVCFGEAFLQGFNALTWQFDEDRHIALPADSPEIVQIRSWTREIGIDVLFGWNELDGDRLYSSCALMGGGEIIHNYRRISRGWKEYSKTDGHYREGASAEVFDYRGRKCLIALCGDLWDYPERFAQGADLLLWPVYVSWTQEEWENGGKAEYAQQAQLCCGCTLYVNSLCDGDAFGGAAVFQGGKVQSELPVMHEGLLIADV